MFLFCLVFAMSLCASIYMCFVAPAGKGLTSWLLFVVSAVSLSLLRHNAGQEGRGEILLENSFLR